MSKALSPRPPVVTARRNIAIVASKFNANYAQGLVDHATAELGNLAPGANLSLHRVPGAFEIPVVVREVAMHKCADAIVAIGVILKGRSEHAEHLARSVTDALQRLAIEYGVPVINCVLSMEDDGQARERCLEDKINRGTEAARAAIEIANVLSDLRKRA